MTVDNAAAAAVTGWPRLDTGDTVRYGIFLRPDAETCRVTAQLQELLRRQFGLVAAAVFPPHLTLLGNIAVTCGVDEMLERVGAAVTGVPPFELPNGGPALVAGALLCRLDAPRLGVLAAAVEAALDGVRGRTDTDYLIGQTSTAHFQGHLTVAGQDLVLRPDLTAEVAAFVADLAPAYPAMLLAAHVSAFVFHSRMWPAAWWQDMTWQHLRSWPLTA